jgi:hypothetical protein
MRPKRVLAITVSVLALASHVWAQATGTINGRIVDQANAVLPGANVVVTQTGTGVTRDAVTNGEGLYSVPALNPGVYTIKVELTGFGGAERTADLVAGATLTVDVQLGLAQLQETVTVSGQSPLVEVTQAIVSSSIRQTEVVQLPILNRSLASMMTLLPGAREVPATGSHGHASSYVSFAGNTGRSFNMYVDGIDNKEDQDGGTLVVYSLEGIEEFRSLGAGFPAEYGKGSTVVVLATKSGTNALHGTGFLFGRNQSLIATDYFSKPENGGFGKQPFKRLQFGGSAGGPLRKNRAWYFASVERIAQDFQLPRSAQIIKELNYLLPLNIGVKVGPAIPQPFRDLLFQAKVNAQATQNNSVFFRVATQRGHVDNAASGISNNRGLLEGHDVLARNDEKLAAASGGWTAIINPRVVNEFRIQYESYQHDDIAPDICGSYPFTSCLLGRLVFPSVSVGVNNTYPDWYNVEHKWQFKNDFSKQMGSHAFKVGGEYIKLPVFYANLNTPGSIVFRDDPSVITNNTNGRYPQGFQTPGVVQSMTIISGTEASGESRKAWSAAAYVQDDWKVNPRVTLNLGVRYDIHEFNNNCCWDQNRTGQILRALGNPNGFGPVPKTDTNNLAPRAGVAWDITGDGSNVARASFGLFYGTGIITSVYASDYQSGPVIYVAKTLTTSTYGVGQLANYAYGVSPIPDGPGPAPTSFLPGGNTTGNWLDPNFKDPLSANYAVGLSHLFSVSTVLSVDYTHVRGYNGWRTKQINPLLPNPANPTGPRVRPLSALTQAVFGDPNLFAGVSILDSFNKSDYDGIDTHFERRFGTNSLIVNYSLAWARGFGGDADFTTQGGAIAPQISSATGGGLSDPWEWGPTNTDERHRVSILGVVNLPGGFNVSPNFTAASARPYTQFRGVNPSADGNLQILCPSGNSDDVGFGAGQVPCGVGNARGNALVNLNARVTKNLAVGAERKVALFAEFYNMLNRANFGYSYFNRADQTATYNKPNGYLGGIGSTSTIPSSFQVQFGARVSF